MNFREMDGAVDDHVEGNRPGTERQTKSVRHERVHLVGTESGVIVIRWGKRMQKSCCSSSMTFTSSGVLCVVEKATMIVS